jgi:hypothetical protein
MGDPRGTAPAGGSLLAVFIVPVLGAVAGIGVFLVVAVQEIPLLVGAYAGGALRD